MPKLKPVKPNYRDVSTWPYLVQQQYAPKPQYFKSWKAARAFLASQVVKIRDAMELCSSDAVQACNDLLNELGALPLEQSSTVCAVIDPETGTKFQAELVRREKL